MRRRECSAKYSPHQGIKREIKCTTIDAFLQSTDIARIDLLKIYAEGHEHAVLKGAENTLAKGVVHAAVQIEFNEMNAISKVFFDDFQKLLPDHNLYCSLPDGLVPLANDPLLMIFYTSQLEPMPIVFVKNILQPDEPFCVANLPHGMPHSDREILYQKAINSEQHQHREYR
ncbi:MAG: FkbM family methyltransferase [Deltaproteobacteria bacterium]|jgi:hypothetical protein|nr:FkbM family methyltransferase [Deltaproteobacteria bacterium]